MNSPCHIVASARRSSCQCFVSSRPAGWPSQRRWVRNRRSRIPTNREACLHAYVWGLAPEFVYRFSKYNNLVTAPRNALGGGGNAAAAWNNHGTNAGDASVLYLNSMMDLSGKKGRGGTKELVLTVPPSRTTTTW